MLTQTTRRRKRQFMPAPADCNIRRIHEAPAPALPQIDVPFTLMDGWGERNGLATFTFRCGHTAQQECTEPFLQSNAHDAARRLCRDCYPGSADEAAFRAWRAADLAATERAVI